MVFVENKTKIMQHVLKIQ